jgi:ABC-type lipoprotein export system ATPase subunit
MSNILELKKITRNYQLNNKTLHIFKDINLSIKTKESVALVGPSGCGKTSLLHIAGLLEAPSSGEVYLNNQKVNWNSDKDLSISRLRDIGFIFQFNNLLDDFNAKENIALPYIISGHEKKIAFDKAEILLSRVGLEDRMKSFPNQLSGGEQQRVAIARSLINEPSIILADEPTGNLDFKSSMNVMELFSELVEEYSCSIILATHDLSIADLQDRIISIDDLRI